jgi:hypothetical protein
MLFASCTAHSQLATYGDWFIVSANDSSGDVIAATGTENGKELFGYRCFVGDSNCLYVLIPNSSCEENSDYPMLLNSSSGASLVNGKCYKKAGGGDQLLLSPYKVIEDAIKNSSGLIGFAIPMQSGAFKAIRFSVRGGSTAIESAERRAADRRRANTDSPSRSRSTIL